MKLVSDKKFVREYIKAYKAGMSSVELAEKLKVSYATVYARTRQYRQKGVNLPELAQGRSNNAKATVEELNNIVNSMLEGK